MPSPQEYAEHWLEQAVGPNLGEDPFMRFMTVWVGFNALYAHEINTVDGDLNQVMEFAKHRELAKVHQLLIRHPNLPDYAQSIEVFAAQGVTNVKTGVRRTISTEEALREVLLCVYQARCNCFHGGKHMKDERDKSLVTAGFVIISNLLSYYMRGTIVGGWNQLLNNIREAQMHRERERAVYISQLFPEQN